ncbi:unnamed protein product [Symbiodinium natans]|uniref:Ubiquitin-like domain-containing protein n=1 Tax=Symbiodinium natans TaxID=878477 RepID=A0A812QD59_9DINO|nr:unnamed protein product [Symbiodinium natans]
MPLHVQVSLLGGSSHPLHIDLEVSPHDLQLQVQRALSVGRGTLLDPSGATLAGAQTVADSGLKDGDVLTWYMRPFHLASADVAAVAALLGDGKVAAWGFPAWGGDSRSVEDLLTDVQHIEATSGAFAAILSDGSVVAWGNSAFGGYTHGFCGNPRGRVCSDLGRVLLWRQ